MNTKHTITLALLLSLAAMAQAANAAEAGKKPYCGPLANSFGPFDYRAPGDPANLSIVETHHFNEGVEAGLTGMGSLVGGDLDYTLRAFPNHARALNTLIIMTKRNRGAAQIPGAHYATECYFERAVRFQPEDSAAWALYAQFLYATGHSERALPMLQKAAELSPENATINYNVGLAYAQQKDYDKALPFAQKAYAAGFPLQGLKQKMVTAGKWVEPPPKPKAEEDEGGATAEAKADAQPAATPETKPETKPEAQPAAQQAQAPQAATPRQEEAVK